MLVEFTSLSGAPCVHADCQIKKINKYTLLQTGIKKHHGRQHTGPREAVQHSYQKPWNRAVPRQK